MSRRGWSARASGLASLSSRNCRPAARYATSRPHRRQPNRRRSFRCLTRAHRPPIRRLPPATICRHVERAPRTSRPPPAAWTRYRCWGSPIIQLRPTRTRRRHRRPQTKGRVAHKPGPDVRAVAARTQPPWHRAETPGQHHQPHPRRHPLTPAGHECRPRKHDRSVPHRPGRLAPHLTLATKLRQTRPALRRRHRDRRADRVRSSGASRSSPRPRGRLWPSTTNPSERRR